MYGWVPVQAKWCLEVDIHTIRNVGQRNDVDIVGNSTVGRRNSRRFNQAREAFAIAIDRLIYPVGDRDVRPGVGVPRVDIALCQIRGSDGSMGRDCQER